MMLETICSLFLTRWLTSFSNGSFRFSCASSACQPRVHADEQHSDESGTVTPHGHRQCDHLRGRLVPSAARQRWSVDHRAFAIADNPSYSPRIVV
jgi:hypothetical protein